jgi:hypothetical protein
VTWRDLLGHRQPRCGLRLASAFAKSRSQLFEIIDETEIFARFNIVADQLPSERNP